MGDNWYKYDNIQVPSRKIVYSKKNYTGIYHMYWVAVLDLLLTYLGNKRVGGYSNINSQVRCYPKVNPLIVIRFSFH